MEMDGKVVPEVHHPQIVVTRWFKTWGLTCGKCGRDFARFALFGKPKCPFCGKRNVPQFNIGY